MNIQIKKNNELTIEERNAIIHLKEEHWKHGKLSQENWLKENLKQDDCHILGYLENGLLLAYLNIVNIECSVDEKRIECYGIGNVCVDKDYEHSGYGKGIVNEANLLIQKDRKQGFLLCHSNLQEFYVKCGWKSIITNNVIVEKKKYNNIVMTFPTSIDIRAKDIIFDRNF